MCYGHIFTPKMWLLIALLVLFSQHILLTAKDALKTPTLEPNTTLPPTEAEISPDTETPRSVAAYKEAGTKTSTTGSFTNENSGIETTTLESQMVTKNTAILPTSSQSHNVSDQQRNATNIYPPAFHETLENSKTHTVFIKQTTDGNSYNDFSNSMKAGPTPIQKSTPTAVEAVVETTKKNERKAVNGFRSPEKSGHGDNHSLQLANNDVSTTSADLPEPSPSEPVSFTSFSPTTCKPILRKNVNFEDADNSVKARCNNVSSSYDFSGQRVGKNSTGASGKLFRRSTSQRPRLEMEYTSTTAGYIQSPWWDGKRKYPKNINDSVTVNVPTNHRVMISFVQLDIEDSTLDNCRYDRLTVTIGSKETSHGKYQKFVLCNSSPFLGPSVFHTDLLTVHFFTNVHTQYLGFKMLFSFHRYPAIPVKTPSGLWNCSVDYWPHFQQHMGMCNSVNECYAGEDEANCSHLYQDCERGSISIGGRCYVLVVHDDNITWNEASNECRSRDAYLASFNTEEEWSDVVLFMTQHFGNKLIYVGLEATSPNVPDIYRRCFQWTDETIVYYYKVNMFFASASHTCSYLTNVIPVWYAQRTTETGFLQMIMCDEKVTDTFLCEKRTQPTQDVPQPIRLQEDDWSGNGHHVTCLKGHVTFSFLACDVMSECWVSRSSSCNAPVTPQPPSFACDNGIERVPYSLVCDHRPDCSDHSDENFCFFSPCDRSETFQCDNKQDVAQTCLHQDQKGEKCVLLKEYCDNVEQCLDGSDERQCPFHQIFDWSDYLTPRSPVTIDFKSNGFYRMKSLDTTVSESKSGDTVCPNAHFRCPGNRTVCLPVFVRCNGVNDCPNREDEMDCDSYVCPGFYRCRASSICVHSSHMCDGVFQCPQRDDEQLCGFVCPENCTCRGLAFFCFGLFPTPNYPELRFLDGRKSMIKLEYLKMNKMLVYLNLAECNLTHSFHVEFPNLRTLDLRRNQLRTITAADLLSMKQLQALTLAGNPLTSLFVTTSDPKLHFQYLQFLDVSDISLITFNVTMFSIFPRLLSLNLSGCGIQSVTEEGFQPLTYLKYLDVQRCPIDEFPTNVFRGLQTLTEVWADNHKLCCSGNLPENFNLVNCHSPSDDISSCDALLRSDFYRVIVSLFAVLALVGNLGSFIYHVFVSRVASDLDLNAFVIHLCVSDFLMGVYLAIIGVADRLYMGKYLWNDTTWENSAVCSMAGFLSLLSSEVSALIICLVTLDRFLVLRFPLSRLHFRRKSAHVACGISWLVGVILAGIPLLPITSHWEFYNQNGICIPLPITKNTFAGHDYSFAVMIIANFVVFLFIAVGQVSICWSIRTNSMAAADPTKTIDLTIARRLISIAMSDFLCWFPIGLLGVLASNGIPIPGQVNVAVAILLLPLNSAINPFLYMINMLLERRSLSRKKRIEDMVMNTMASKYPEITVNKLDDAVYTKKEAINLIKSWIAAGLLSLKSLEVVVMNEKERINKN